MNDFAPEDVSKTVGLGLLLFAAQISVMFALPHLGVEHNVWTGLLTDAALTSLLAIGAIGLWLRIGYNAETLPLIKMALKTASVIFVVETGLMLGMDFLHEVLLPWQLAIFDGFFFAVMASPIVYHWAVKSAIRQKYAESMAMPVMACVAVAFAVFMFDLSMPLGVSCGTLYVVLVMIGLWFPHAAAPFVLAAIATVLTLLGYQYSPPGGIFWMVVLNRAISIFIIWITAVLASRHKKIMDDINDQREEVEAALRSEKKYGDLQRQFVSLVSHELRTPLTIIDGSAQRIIRSIDDISSAQLVDRCTKIRHAVRRMVDLIEGTLYASRLDANKIKANIQDCDIKRLIAEVCDRYVEISPRHDIRIDLDGLPETIEADPGLLEHVFTNLISNAVKYTDDDPVIQVAGGVDGNAALISIRDNGVGIPSDDLPRIFERYFRAKTAEGVKGTGIGLSVSKQFVEMHGGTLEVASVEGRETTFTIRLPISHNELMQAEAH